MSIRRPGRDRKGKATRALRERTARACLLVVGTGGGDLLVRVDVAERVEGADEVHLLPCALLSGQPCTCSTSGGNERKVGDAQVVSACASEGS
jgi:hypothetical protein